MSEWQPIETAPKDGTEFLITDGDIVAQGFWNDRDSAWPWAWHDTTAGGEHYEGHLNGFREQGATHWMPLPEPPNA